MSEFEGKAEDIYSERVFRILTPSETSDLISSATARFHHALGRRGVVVAALPRKTVYAALRYLPSGAPAMVRMLPSPIGAPGTGVRFDLGPFEQLFIGKCVLTNSRARAFFTVEGQLPILQGKDVCRPNWPFSSLEKLYCCVQQMYLDESHEEHQGSYLALAARSLTENPTLALELQATDQLIASRQHYKALKALKKLIEFRSIYRGWKRVGKL